MLHRYSSVQMQYQLATISTIIKTKRIKFIRDRNKMNI